MSGLIGSVFSRGARPPSHQVSGQ